MGHTQVFKMLKDNSLYGEYKALAKRLLALYSGKKAHLLPSFVFGEAWLALHAPRACLCCHRCLAAVNPQPFRLASPTHPPAWVCIGGDRPTKSQSTCSSWTREKVALSRVARAYHAPRPTTHRAPAAQPPSDVTTVLAWASCRCSSHAKRRREEANVGPGESRGL